MRDRHCCEVPTSRARVVCDISAFSRSLRSSSATLLVSALAIGASSRACRAPHQPQAAAVDNLWTAQNAVPIEMALHRIGCTHTRSGVEPYEGVSAKSRGQGAGAPGARNNTATPLLSAIVLNEYWRATVPFAFSMPTVDDFPRSLA